MNDTLQKFARQQLLEGLAKLPDGHQRTFKLMYARNGGKTSVEDAEKTPIEQVVENVPEENLDWAMQQVERSLLKIANTTAKN